MSPDTLVPILSAIVGVVMGGMLTHLLSTRRDVAVKRREIILNHLVMALEELSKASAGRPDTDLKSLERVVFRVHMVGDKPLYELARKTVFELTDTGKSNTTPLFIALRNRVRSALQLEALPDDFFGLVVKYPGDKGFEELRTSWNAKQAGTSPDEPKWG